MAKILIIEDESDLRELISFNLEMSGFEVLTARVQTALRKNSVDSYSKKVCKIVLHNLSIDPARHETLLDDNFINFSATEFSILKFLAENPGWVFSRNEWYHTPGQALDPSRMGSFRGRASGYETMLSRHSFGNARKRSLPSFHLRIRSLTPLRARTILLLKGPLMFRFWESEENLVILRSMIETVRGIGYRMKGE